MASTRLAPGFRFHPTDVELIMYYLKRKVLGKKLSIKAISELNIYKFDPWDLPDKSCIESEDRQWYFFCPTEKKYASRGRMNRSAETGYWKGTGKDRSIPYQDRVVGMVKTLIFHRGHPPKGERTDWVMHEYRMQDQQLADSEVPQDAFVICKLFEKDGLGARKSAHCGATFKEEEWEDKTFDCDETMTTESPSVATAAGTQLLTTPCTSELITMGGPEVLSICPLDEQDPPSLLGDDNVGILSMEDVDFESMWDSFTKENIPSSQFDGPVTGDAFVENDLFSGLSDLCCNWPAFGGSSGSSSFSFSEMQPFQDSYLELNDLNNCDPNCYLKLNDHNVIRRRYHVMASLISLATIIARVQHKSVCSLPYHLLKAPTRIVINRLPELLATGCFQRQSEQRELQAAPHMVRLTPEFSCRYHLICSSFNTIQFHTFRNC